MLYQLLFIKQEIERFPDLLVKCNEVTRKIAEAKEALLKSNELMIDAEKVKPSVATMLPEDQKLVTKKNTSPSLSDGRGTGEKIILWGIG